MTPLEKLMAEYDNELTFVFKDDMPDGLAGLHVDGVIFINENMSFEKALATLAEEIGHYKTSINSDITDYSKKINIKQENLARRWSYNKLIPLHQLKSFIAEKEVVYKHDIAEEFGIPHDVAEEVIYMYKIKGEI